MLNTPHGRFRFFAVAEGISCIALFLVAMPMKYAMGIKQAIQIPGLVHGILFLLYLGVTLQISQLEKWPASKLLLGWFCGFIPFSTFWFESKVRKELA
jgi:integral membrane protein